jgi:hypothetical protein
MILNTYLNNNSELKTLVGPVYYENYTVKDD